MADHDTTTLRVLLDPSGRTVKEIFSDEDLARLRARFSIVWAKDEPIPLEVFEREKRDLFAIVCCGWRFGPVTEMPSLKAICEVGGGLPDRDRLDYDTCFDRRIRVLSCAPAFGPMVAEMALGLAIDCARGISRADREFRAGTERWLHAGNVGTFTLYGRRVGIVGYGGLARSLRRLLQPFRCPVSAYDPWLTDRQLENEDVDPRSLEQVMAESDVIFVLAVPTRHNRALIDRRLLEMIRPGRVFVLASRAHVVDFDALTDLVRRGRFRAAIDVFPREPLPGDHPIRSAEDAVLSAHRAGAVEDDLQLIGRMVVDDLEAIGAGLPPRRLQNAEPELVARM